MHHVIICGIERRHILRDDNDRDDFPGRIEGLLSETHIVCYAWALMSNHAHFLFRTGDVPLSRLMRRLLTGYVVRFNRKHRRHGQLFQNRCQSIICQEDAYLNELVRYIQRKNERIKGDQRILGRSEFVSEVLQQADAKYERYYALRKKGYGLATVEERVCGIYGIDPDPVYSKSRVQPLGDARGAVLLLGGRSVGV